MAPEQPGQRTRDLASARVIVMRVVAMDVVTWRSVRIPNTLTGHGSVGRGKFTWPNSSPAPISIHS